MGQHHRPRSPVEPETIPTDTTDPVCGMTVDPEHAAGTSVYQGRRYLFCSSSCLTRFQAAPEQYLRDRMHGGGARCTPGVAYKGHRRVYLSDAPGGPPTGPRRLPEVRHGARARHPGGAR